MARGRIGAGGPFLVPSVSGNFTTTVKKRPIVVVSIQTNVRSQLRYRFKTKIQLGPVFGKKPIFPAAIWVTQVVQKRVSISARTVARLALGEPTNPAVVVATAKIKPIRFVSLVEFKRNRPKTKVQLTSKFGKPTTKVNVVGPVLVNKVSKIRKPLRGKVVLGKPTRVVVVVSPKFRVGLLKISQHIDTRARPKTRIQFTKKYGKSTTRPKSRPIAVLKFATGQLIIKRKYVPGKVTLGKAPVVGIPPVGSTITFYDGIWVADGLTYHHGLDRPTIILTPVGGGKYTVVKVSGLSDEIASQLSKETILIDGELP